MKLKTFAVAVALSALPLAAAAHDGHKAPTAATPFTSPAAAAATKVVEAFHLAIAKGDLATAAALLADDAVIYEHGGVERSKAAYVAEHLPADAAYSRGMTDTVLSRRAEVHGAFAWVITDGRTTGTYNGKQVNRVTTETMILKKTAAGWRIVHIHWSSGNAPAA